MDPLKTFLPYDPSPVPNDVFAGLFFLFMAAFSFYILKRREWWALCLPVGCLVQAVGYINRVRFAKHTSAGLYFTGDLFVTVAPVAYLAFNYIIFARLCFGIERDIGIWVRGSLTVIPNKVFKTIFVLSDVITFLAQTAGGMMQIFDSVASIGKTVLVIGIVLQAVSYLIFTAIVIRSYTRWNAATNVRLQRACRRIYSLLFLSSALIILRSLYRCIELPTRPNGALAKSEAAFFVLDVVPLTFAVGIYIVFWPSKIVALTRPQDGVELALIK